MSQYYTLEAASSASPVSVPMLFWASRIASPPPPSCWVRPRLGEVFAYDLSTDVDEHLVDVRCLSRARLVVGYVAPALRKLERLGSGYDTILLQIGLVPYQYHGEVRVTLRPYDLVPEFDEFSEGRCGSNTKHEKESLAETHVHVSVLVVSVYAMYRHASASTSSQLQLC